MHALLYASRVRVEELSMFLAAHSKRVLLFLLAALVLVLANALEPVEGAALVAAVTGQRASAKVHLACAAFALEPSHGHVLLHLHPATQPHIAFHTAQTIGMYRHTKSTS